MAEDAQRSRDEASPGDHGASRAVDGAWEFGAAASAAMAERVRDLYRQLPQGSVGAADLDAELRRLRVDVERGADVLLDLFDRALVLLRRLDQIERPDDAGVAEELVISVAPGDRGTGELWAHNVSDREHAVPKLRCGPLSDWDGRALPDSTVRVTATPHPIHGWSSRRIELTVDVPPDAAPGAYRGLLLARGDPDVAIRVRIEVVPR